MLMNNLDPEIAERPGDLVVYGGTGKAARNWECFEAIVHALRALENDETLLVQSGKPVPEDTHLRRWIALAREKVQFQGLPARICWLGQGQRARFGAALNDLVALPTNASRVMVAQRSRRHWRSCSRTDIRRQPSG